MLALEADRLRVTELQIQISNIRHVLGSACVADSDFDSEKQTHDLERFSSDLCAAQERLDSYKYPVLTLPSELISEIFLRVLPPYTDFPQLNGPCSPTPLTQVCRRWRDIAVGTPELWSAISSLNNNYGGRELPIIELWLERSRGWPLSLKLGTTGWARDELVAAVVPHRARWQYLKIDVEANHLPIFDAPAMPLLRHLELITTSTEDDAGTKKSPIVTRGVPLLRTVVLNDAAAVRITLPWMQLTSLTLIRVFPSEFIPILMQTRNLVYCELHVFHNSSRNAVSYRDGRIPLLFLESLALIHCGIHPVTGLLPTLIVPALRSLKISETLLSPDPIESLTAFISTFDCRLEELHLIGERLLPRSSYRQTFPSLRKVLFSNDLSDDPMELDPSDS
ncbi:hypothetical protein C8R47DRAFT_1325752 [Mycena vitilis]|nr:hypothetical protein C8R47DRAFT_1325752 [Mycena vitilis]